jgi:hypothetical protein
MATVQDALSEHPIASAPGEPHYQLESLAIVARLAVRQPAFGGKYGAGPVFGPRFIRASEKAQQKQIPLNS